MPKYEVSLYRDYTMQIRVQIDAPSEEEAENIADEKNDNDEYDALWDEAESVNCEPHISAYVKLIEE